MDDNLSKAVNEAFVRLHEQKLIYRYHLFIYLINYFYLDLIDWLIGVVK
jgi:valyl-tRNA synthetase